MIALLKCYILMDLLCNRSRLDAGLHKSQAIEGFCAIQDNFIFHPKLFRLGWSCLGGLMNLIGSSLVSDIGKGRRSMFVAVGHAIVDRLLWK